MRRGYIVGLVRARAGSQVICKLIKWFLLNEIEPSKQLLEN